MVNAKTWNPAQIDQAIRRLEGIIRSGSYNPAELNQLLNQLGEPGYISTWNPAELDQKLRTLLHDLLSWKNTTGNPIQLRTNNGGLVKSCEVTFSPIQDLHGQDAPYPAGGGKNKLPLTLSTIKSENTSGTWNGNVYSVSSATFTVITDDGGNVESITVNGTPSATVNLFFPEAILTDGTAYKLNGCPSGGSISTYALMHQSNSNIIDSGNGIEFIKASTDNGVFRIRIQSGYTCNNLLFKPMLRFSTEMDATFAPYSNYCPISGWDSLHLYIDTEQTETPEKTHTATFSETVYGGKYNYTTGKLTVNKVIIDIGDITLYYDSGSTRFYSSVISDLQPCQNSQVADVLSTIYRAEKVSGQSSLGDYSIGVSNDSRFYVFDKDYSDVLTYKTARTGQKICYKLATPTEITLTPEDIELLAGDNVLWTYGDNIEITYKKLLLPSDVETLSKIKKIEEKPKTKRSKKKKEE